MLARIAQDIEPPTIVTDQRMSRFVRTLRECGFDTANCAQRLGVFPRLGVNFWPAMRPGWTANAADLVDTLILLFLDGCEMPINLVAQQFSPEFVDGAIEMRLAERRGDSLVSNVCVFPCYGKYIVTDQAARNTKINQVMWLWGESFILGGLVKRRPCRSGVDLGTGSGIHAILASDHCERVTAVDINPRAISFAKFNAALNGRTNLDFVLSDLFESVGGTFDLLLANPPYAPDFAAKPGENFWSGGASGMDLLRRIIEALPARLERDGAAYIVALFPVPAGTTIRGHFDMWLRGAVDEWDVLDHTWPVPRYQDLLSEQPFHGDKSAWRFGVVSLRRAVRGKGWWREVAGAGGASFFRRDGSCAVVSDHDAA